MTTPTPANPALLSDDAIELVRRDATTSGDEIALTLIAHIAAQAAELQDLRERVEKAEKDAVRLEFLQDMLDRDDCLSLYEHRTKVLALRPCLDALMAIAKGAEGV